MTRHKIRIAVFVSVILVSALLSWLGGYNFDHRGVDVVFTCVVVLLIALWGAAFP